MPSPPDTPQRSAEIFPQHRLAKKLHQIPRPIMPTQKPNRKLQPTSISLADDLGGLIAGKTGDMPAAITQVQRAATTYDSMAFDFGPPRNL